MKSYWSLQNGWLFYASWCLRKTRASPELAIFSILLFDFSIRESQIVFALYSVKRVFLIIFLYALGCYATSSKLHCDHFSSYQQYYSWLWLWPVSRILFSKQGNLRISRLPVIFKAGNNRTKKKAEFVFLMLGILECISEY